MIDSDRLEESLADGKYFSRRGELETTLIVEKWVWPIYAVFGSFPVRHSIRNNLSAKTANRITNLIDYAYVLKWLLKTNIESNKEVVIDKTC